MIRRLMAFLSTSLLLVALAACSSGAGPSPSAGGSLTVTDAWARPSTGMAMAGAAYLTITNGTGAADALLSVTTAAASTAEVHETTQSSDGMMGMHPIDRLEVPAGGTVKLEPGGYHVMLIGLTGDLVAGAKIELTLTFEKAGAITVTAEVRAS